MQNPIQPFRCGYIAILGEPNVGKSTFLNAVLDLKLSIVSEKPQTTRRQILGLLNGENHQIVFLDTPGLIRPKYVLQQSMLASALHALRDSDGVIFLLDGEKLQHRETLVPSGLVEMLVAARKPLIVLLNKSDLIPDAAIRDAMFEKLTATLPCRCVLAVSALKQEGLDRAIREIISILPISEPLYPPDIASDQPQRFFVSEIIREKIFHLFREEIPYATEVMIVSYKENEDMDIISADIVVERESQRKILIGSKGSSIKQIGIDSRKDIEEFTGKRAFLELYVKIRKDWRDDRAWVRRFGYDVE